MCGVCTRTCMLARTNTLLERLATQALSNLERLEELSRAPSKARGMGSDNARRKSRPDSGGAKISAALISPPYHLLCQLQGWLRGGTMGRVAGSPWLPASLSWKRGEALVLNAFQSFGCYKGWT